jgi:hypothetical protein
MKNSFSRRVVLGGISTALIILSLYGGTVIRTNKIAFMVLATFGSALPYIGGNISTGVLSYISSAILGWLILPNKLYGIVYALFGIYPLIKLKSEKFKVGFEFLLKYLWFNITLIMYYIFFKNFVYLNSFFLSTQGIIILIIAAEGLFFVYDYIFTKFIMLVQDRVLK